MPGIPKSEIKNCLDTTACQRLQAIGENNSRFEVAHGEIKDSEQPSIILVPGQA
jgi:hypothetical protein